MSLICLIHFIQSNPSKIDFYPLKTLIIDYFINIFNVFIKIFNFCVDIIFKRVKLMVR